jgi:hypothetical protein
MYRRGIWPVSIFRRLRHMSIMMLSYLASVVYDGQKDEMSLKGSDMLDLGMRPL